MCESRHAAYQFQAKGIDALQGSSVWKDISQESRDRVYAFGQTEIANPVKIIMNKLRNCYVEELVEHNIKATLNVDRSGEVVI